MITSANTRLHSLRVLAKFPDLDGRKLKQMRETANKEARGREVGAFVNLLVDEIDKVKAGSRIDIKEILEAITKIKNAPKEETIPKRYNDKSGFELLAAIKKAADANQRREAIEKALGNGIFPNGKLDFGDIERRYTSAIFDMQPKPNEARDGIVDEYGLEIIRSNQMIQTPNSRISLVEVEDLLFGMFKGESQVVSATRYHATEVKMGNKENVSFAIVELVGLAIYI